MGTTEEREQAAVARWRPAQRWYHPAVAWVVVGASRFIMTRMNKLEVEGRERLDAAMDREPGRGLLTTSNHVSLFDDPMLISNFVRGPYKSYRWVSADALNFFGSGPKAWLFTAGRSVPIVRGQGLEQEGMHFLRDRLLAGDWVHVFGEGGRTRDPDARLGKLLKPGLGWMIAEAQPLVLPFYHTGMQKVLPVGAVRPRRGNTVRLRFGEIVDYNDAHVKEIGTRAGTTVDGPRLWSALSADVRERLAALERTMRPDLYPATVTA
jgi:monolysocardiolipin acyltransferase